LRTVFPASHPVHILYEKPTGRLDWNNATLHDLIDISTPIAALYLPKLSPDSSMEGFQDIIAHLRAPDGCPWDKKQTHDSLRTYLLEETYETLEVLDKHDMKGLQEELGDLLLQIALHAQIASEKNEFNLTDVIQGIHRKIVYRHPHVFSDWKVEGEEGVVQNWEALKIQERKGEEEIQSKGMLDGIPSTFPALAQAQAIQDRAARVGFDWPEIAPVIAKVLEELEEVRTAPDDNSRAKELGDLLFAVVNLVRWHKVDAESALRLNNLKFKKRFAYIEKKASENNKDLPTMSLSEMDAFWEESKEFDDE
jgi:tetrapyrrole methylase family protein/MazG family protein